MGTVIGRFGRALPAGFVVLALGACSNTAAPTSATATGIPAVATVAAEQESETSILVQGTVVDDAGRALANAEVECMGNVQCVHPLNQVIQQDGPDDGVRTNGQGAYQMLVRRSGGSERFLMNALARGYEYHVREVAFPDGTCTAQRAGCTVTVDFTLRASE